MRLMWWLAVPLLVLSAVMLVASMGSPGFWIAMAAVGLAFVAVDARHSSVHR